jgi:uncharacterized membrane protein YecN with MAPEG domain
MSEIVFRWSGIGLILGAALLGIAIIVISFKPVINQPFPVASSVLLLLAAILLLLSLPAVYARQANAAGWLGLTGHVLLQTGVILLIVLAAPSLIYPTLKLTPGENPLVFLLGIALTLGLLLTGIATIRAGIFPRAAGILLLVAMAGFFFDFFIAEFLPPVAGQVGSALFGVLLALSFAWIGAALWIGKLGPAIGNVIPTP